MSLIEKLKFDETERITEDERKYKVPFRLGYVPPSKEVFIPSKFPKVPGKFKLILADRTLGEKRIYSKYLKETITWPYLHTGYSFYPDHLLNTAYFLLRPANRLIIEGKLDEPLLDVPLEGISLVFGDGSAVSIDLNPIDEHRVKAYMSGGVDPDKANFEISSIPQVILSTKNIVRQIVDVYNSMFRFFSKYSHHYGEDTAKLIKGWSKMYDKEYVDDILRELSIRLSEN